MIPPGAMTLLPRLKAGLTLLWELNYCLYTCLVLPIGDMIRNAAELNGTVRLSLSTGAWSVSHRIDYDD